MTMTDTEFAAQMRELVTTDLAAVDSAPATVQELVPASPTASPAVAMAYTHEAMVELMIAHPEFTHAQFAAHFGRGVQWFSYVLSSEAFQAVLTPRKHEVADPGLTATMEERMRALSLQALDVLGKKLEAKEINDQTVLKAVEIGTKALGMGSSLALAVPVVQAQGAEAVADRIMEAMAQARARQQAASNQSAVDVEVKVRSNGS